MLQFQIPRIKPVILQALVMAVLQPFAIHFGKELFPVVKQDKLRNFAEDPITVTVIKITNIKNER